METGGDNYSCGCTCFGKQHNGLEITYDIVEDALRTTTEDFRGETADWSDGSVSSKFDGIKEKLNVTFKLAKIDPNGILLLE